MAKYIVDVTHTTVHSYQVEADNKDEAEDRYSDGIIVHSEAQAPYVSRPAALA